METGSPPPLHPLPSARRAAPPVVRLLAVAVIACIAATSTMGWYGYERISALTERIALLEAGIATTTSQLQRGIAESSSTLQQQASMLQNQIGTVQQQFGTISGTVDSLQKLSRLDPELLKKYSKVYFLNENYMPASLSDIQKDYTINPSRDYSILTPVLPYLVAMINAAKQSNIDLYVDSAYRSFGEQQALKGEYTVVFGQGTANQFSAEQGYSEHQLGTTVDLTTQSIGTKLTGFDGTPAYQWLSDNAYRFGFILSYPKNNGYYIYEPWHWRFVGVKLATYLHDNAEHFYDMDQRDIDQYLASIFD